MKNGKNLFTYTYIDRLSNKKHCNKKKHSIKSLSRDFQIDRHTGETLNASQKTELSSVSYGFDRPALA